MDHLRLSAFFADLDTLPSRSESPHQFHPYPAKFKPQIPAELISVFSSEGDSVLDPMSGSGTTAVEALRLGRNAVSSDSNPISALITRAKTTRLSDAARNQLESLPDAIYASEATLDSAPDFFNREHWFSFPATAALARIKSEIREIGDPAARDVALATMSAILVGVSNQESETHWRRVEREVTVDLVLDRFTRKLRSNVESLMYLDHVNGKSKTLLAAANDLPLEGGSQDLIVTSPPYANSHDYYLYHKLRLFWLDFDVRKTQEVEFGSRNKHSDKKQPIETYLSAMEAVFNECRRVLAPGGHLAMVVGDSVIRGEFFDMGELLVAVARDCDLGLAYSTSYDQRKYSRVFRQNRDTAIHKRTHVLVFER